MTLNAYKLSTVDNKLMKPLQNFFESLDRDISKQIRIKINTWYQDEFDTNTLHIELSARSINGININTDQVLNLLFNSFANIVDDKNKNEFGDETRSHFKKIMKLLNKKYNAAYIENSENKKKYFPIVAKPKTPSKGPALKVNDSGGEIMPDEISGKIMKINALSKDKNFHIVRDIDSKLVRCNIDTGNFQFIKSKVEKSIKLKGKYTKTTKDKQNQDVFEVDALIK